MSIPLLSLEDVEAAAVRIHGAVADTPFLHSETLSQIVGAELWLKFENLQFTGSFKQRGAVNTLLMLSPAERACGVIAVSAGNHAQGVAYHAAKLGIPATIVMPRGTPGVKIARTRALGAEVILAGNDFAEASATLATLAAERGASVIHPFDDDRVIAGQGTVALEMLRDQPALDAMVIALGGGGLLSGVAVAATAMAPRTELIGVQSERFPSMAMATGRWDGAIAGGPTIAEGIAVAVPGHRTRAHISALVQDIVVVREAVIEHAITLLLQIEKTLVEGAGAAGLAAVMAQPERYRGRRVGLILCGGNIDNRLLTAIINRQQARDGTLVRIRVKIPDRQGTLGQLCSEIGALGGNINSVQHDRGSDDADAKSAIVNIEYEVNDPLERHAIAARLTELGFATTCRG